MELRQLRYFVGVVEHGGFTRAAEALRISQPALGLQIKKLEEELRVSLFFRHSRGVELTEAGALLLKYARSILDEVAAAATAVKAIRPEPAGRVRVGMAPTLALMLSRRLITEVNERHPGIHLDVVEAGTPILSDMISTQRVDIALSCETGQHSAVNREHILDEGMYLVQSARSTNKHFVDIPFRELGDYPLVIADPMLSRILLDKLETTSRVLNVKLNILRVLPSIDTVKEMVEDGTVCTIMPYVNVRRECERGWLSVRRIIDPPLLRIAYLLTPRGAVLSTAASATCAVMRDILRESRDILPEAGLVFGDQSTPFAGSEIAQGKPAVLPAVS